ncbi:Uncharacterised protein [uncultured Clostridium sp.]|nr:Uncharacterised protein [uncultured Clostridium sp.]
MKLIGVNLYALIYLLLGIVAMFVSGVKKKS